MRKILWSRRSLREPTECNDIIYGGDKLLTVSKRFRWVFCQLEALQDCLPSSIRHTLEELPEALDETYERILKEIKKPSRVHAHRLLQCLSVAIRPLLVEELAELLAFDFDAAEGGIPKMNPKWRRGEHEQFVLSICSSLIAVVDHGGFRVVQFSHFLVKEFLTSDRLSASTSLTIKSPLNSPKPSSHKLGQGSIAPIIRVLIRKPWLPCRRAIITGTRRGRECKR